MDAKWSDTRDSSRAGIPSQSALFRLSLVSSRVFFVVELAHTPQMTRMTERKYKPSRAVQKLIETMFKGNKILDPKAYAEARKDLAPEDQRFLDDLRETALEVPDFDEDDLVDDDELDLDP